MASLALPNPKESSPMESLGSALSTVPQYGANAAEDLYRKQAETAQTQIRTVTQILDGIATQFPAASKEVDGVKQGMVKVLARIVGSQVQPPSQSGTGITG